MANSIDLTGYHLTFDAEMSSSADMAKFSYSYQDGGRTLYSNHEAQYYADYDPAKPGSPFAFQNGALTITASPTPAGGVPYTSGLIQTANTFTQNEGYFEIRAQTPDAHGFWSAFWMLPKGAYFPEVDILEQPNNSGSNSQYWFHVATPTDNSGYFTDTGTNVYEGYHSYGFKWTSSTIEYFFDGKSIGYLHQTPAELANLQMYLIANLAVGGAGSWPGEPAAGAAATYKIDYIRAYSTDPDVPAVALGTISSPDGVDTSPAVVSPTPPVPVAPSNTPPTVTGLSAFVLAGATVAGSAGVLGTGALAGASDPDGDALTVSAVAGGAIGQSVSGSYGHLTLNGDGSYGYVADHGGGQPGLPRHDSFSFTVSDGRGGNAASVLDITITSPPAASSTDSGGAGTSETPGSGGAGGAVPTPTSTSAVPNPSHADYFGTVSHGAASVGGKVYALYDGLLGRAPDPLGLEYSANALSHGQSVRDLAQAFLASPEGQSRAGALENVSFVEQLYESALHRHSDPVGLESWTAALDHGASRADVAVGFALSAEHLAAIQAALDAGVFVPDANAASAARLYYGILDRAPDASGLAAWTSAIQHGTTLEGVAQQFFTSPEAQAKFAGVSDATFVSGLYENALGRPAETTGLQHWVDALQHGATRAGVSVQIAESQEAQIHLVGQIETGWHLV